MGNKKDKHIFTILFSISCLLMISAIVMVNASFGSIEASKSKTWIITVSEINTDTEYILNNNIIDFKVSLDNIDDFETIKLAVNNTGDYDAVLTEFISSKLNEIEVTKVDDKVVTLSDLIIVTKEYYLTNKTNLVKETDYLKTGDLLKKNTTNDILITVKYKNDLTDELKSLINEKIEFNMSFGLKYDSVKE